MIARDLVTSRRWTSGRVVAVGPQGFGYSASKALVPRPVASGAIIGLFLCYNQQFFFAIARLADL